MASVKTVLRKCPECGHRFEVKETEKRLESVERHTEEYNEPLPYIFNRAPGHAVAGVTYPTKKSFSVTMKEYSNSYRCSRCGHEWTETGVEERHGDVRPFPSSQMPLKKHSAIAAKD